MPFKASFLNSREIEYSETPFKIKVTEKTRHCLIRETWLEMAFRVEKQERPRVVQAVIGEERQRGHCIDSSDIGI